MTFSKEGWGGKFSVKKAGPLSGAETQLCSRKKKKHHIKVRAKKRDYMRMCVYTEGKHYQDGKNYCII